MASSDPYEKLVRLQLSESAMKTHSYPRPHPVIHGRALISNSQSKYTKIPSQLRRTCRRCETPYAVDKDGKAVNPSHCSYHPYRKPNPGKPYRCCYRNRTAKPCKTASQHVHRDIDMDNLVNYLVTKDNETVTKKDAYAIDTEMIYTEAGMEVAALTVVDTNCEVVYETLVNPDHPVVDYNTEFSGLKESDFKDVTTTMKDVHDKFRTLFGPNTILVGHGLANDLIFLRVLHDRVVDTLDVYPHKNGLPFLTPLQYLKDNYLSFVKITPGPYKCREDAIAAMKLALRK